MLDANFLDQMSVIKSNNIWKAYDKAVYCHSDYLTYMQSTSWKYWTGWVTSWNQDSQEKYQQPHICEWYHSSGRKQRGTQELLDDGEGGEWKTQLKTKY